MGNLRVQGGGSGDRLLLLLHGLGATGDVWGSWAPLLAEAWPGRWLAPDLPGHGGSAPLAEYSFDGFAAAVAALVEPTDRVVVLGHSLGGAVGLALRLRRPVAAVIGLGIKVAWTAEELDRARALGERPVAWLGSRDEAANRYLRVSGLAGLVDADAAVVDAGLREEDGRWRLAMDPRTFAVGAPDMTALLAPGRTGAPLAPVRGEVLLARGENDHMVGDEQLAALPARAVTLPGLGHNAHVEDPAAVLRLLHPYA